MCAQRITHTTTSSSGTHTYACCLTHRNSCSDLQTAPYTGIPSTFWVDACGNVWRLEPCGKRAQAKGGSLHVAWGELPAQMKHQAPAKQTTACMQRWMGPLTADPLWSHHRERLTTQTRPLYTPPSKASCCAQHNNTGGQQTHQEERQCPHKSTIALLANTPIIVIRADCCWPRPGASRGANTQAQDQLAATTVPSSSIFLVLLPQQVVGRLQHPSFHHVCRDTTHANAHKQPTNNQARCESALHMTGSTSPASKPSHRLTPYRPEKHAAAEP